MIEFEVAGQVYKAKRMSAMVEESVTRKLAPLLNMAIPALAALKSGQGKIDFDTVSPDGLIRALTSAFADLRDDHAQFILASCLGVVERRKGDAWAQVWSAGAGRPMFDDIRAPQMYLIAAKVMEAAFRDFMAALGPSFSAGGDPQASTPSDSPTA